MECAPDKLAQNRWQVLDALMGAKAYRTRLLRPTGVARDCPLGSTALDNIAIETGSPINPALTSFKRPHLLGRTEGICLQTTAVIIRPKPLSRHLREENMPATISTISSHPVEDLWRRGHSNDLMRTARKKYFWIVDLLKNPQHWYLFNPDNIPDDPILKNIGDLQFATFRDWEYYRATPDMLKEGIELLDQWFAQCMNGNYNRGVHTRTETDLIILIIAKLGGILGFRPTFVPTQGTNGTQWRPRPRNPVEMVALHELVRIVANQFADKNTFEKSAGPAIRRYGLIMANEIMNIHLLDDYFEKLTDDEKMQQLEPVMKRVLWHTTEMNNFISICRQIADMLILGEIIISI